MNGVQINVEFPFNFIHQENTAYGIEPQVEEGIGISNLF